jgi:LmbE family N-acetylglucosaminyl deacetylase
MNTSSQPGPAEVRRVRLQELQNAARVLGVADLVVLEHQDGMLPWIDAGRLESDILGTIRRLRPDVVVTFGEDGLYGHPDHIAIHERTTAAVAALGTDAPALYYVTMPGGRMKDLVQHVAAVFVARGDPGEPPRKILGIADVDAFGALAARPTLVVEVGRFAATKLAAIKCHRTQLEEDAFALVAEEDAARLLGTEHFHRADVGSRSDAFIERFAAAVHLRS